MSRWRPGRWSSQLPDRRRPWRRTPLTPATLGALILGLPWLLTPSLVQAIPSDGITAPLPTRVETFQPDPQVCKPEAIRAGFNSQLQPWADQPPAVLARLRDLQLEMVRGTLRRCVSKGLMEAPQAEQLFLQLVAPSSAGASAPAPASSAPSAAAPASVSPAPGGR